MDFLFEGSGPDSVLTEAVQAFPIIVDEAESSEDGPEGVREKERIGKERDSTAGKGQGTQPQNAVRAGVALVGVSAEEGKEEDEMETDGPGAPRTATGGDHMEVDGREEPESGRRKGGEGGEREGEGDDSEADTTGEDEGNEDGDHHSGGGGDNEYIGVGERVKERYSYPTATSLSEFLRWPAPKRRAAEWLRAKEVKRRVKVCVYVRVC